MSPRPEDQSMSRPPGWRAGFPWLVCGLYFALFLGFAILLPDHRLVPFFNDDAFYYIQPASNIAAGNGPTFDGVNATNGYHPLYMLFLAGCCRIYELKGFAGLRAVLLIDAALYALGLFLFMKLLARFAIGAAPALAAV